MNKNIGTPDKLLRLGIGIALLFLAIYFKSGFLVIFGLFSIFEALSGWCAFYQLIGKNTCPIKNKNENNVPLLQIFLIGISLLIGAILLNIIAVFFNFLTWYDLFKDVNNISKTGIDNLIYLFIIYPFSLGFIAYLINNLLKNK